MSHALPPPGSHEFPQSANLLLGLLPAPERQLVLAKCSGLEIKSHQLVYAAGDPLKYLYFLNSGLASKAVVMDDGRCAEVTSTGHEGLLGISALMGGEWSPYRCIMLVGGHAWKIPSGELQKLSERGGLLPEVLRRYTLVRMLQAHQVAACNAVHNLTRRLSRWLLKAGDHLASDMLPLTHEFLAEALGTQRSSISLTAQKLERRGIIAYKRARIRILDRPGLERCSCECYGNIRRALEALLGRLGDARSPLSSANPPVGVSGRFPAA